jgi:uncharacterized protein (UPF0548 family)
MAAAMCVLQVRRSHGKMLHCNRRHCIALSDPGRLDACRNETEVLTPAEGGRSSLKNARQILCRWRAEARDRVGVNQEHRPVSDSDRLRSWFRRMLNRIN